MADITNMSIILSCVQIWKLIWIRNSDQDHNQNYQKLLDSSEWCKHHNSPKSRHTFLSYDGWQQANIQTHTGDQKTPHKILLHFSCIAIHKARHSNSSTSVQRFEPKCALLVVIHPRVLFMFGISKNSQDLRTSTISQQSRVLTDQMSIFAEVVVKQSSLWSDFTVWLGG